jgi:hypothetical protein
VIRNAVILGLGLAASIALSGCGLITLIHDSMIGPVSPLGRLNAVTVGSDFHVTELGPVAELGDDSRLRPFPRDLIRRTGTPASYWSLGQGIEALLTSIAPVATRETRVGRGAGERLPAELRPGVPVGVALALLGPPDLWVRRSGGSFMLYRGISQRAWSFYLGVPPPAAVLIPVPGIANLRFRYLSDRERASKVMLFFDERDVLVETSVSVEASGPSE